MVYPLIAREASYVPYRKDGDDTTGVANLEAMKYERFSDEDIDRFVTIANQPSVRRWIIDEHVGVGQPFDRTEAERYILEADKNWSEGKRFDYLVRDERQDVKGVINLQSPNRDMGWLGYWFDTEGKRGYANTAVLALEGLAAAAGYSRLTAKVRKPNIASKNVLLRAEFKVYDPHKTAVYDFYEKQITPERTAE